MHSSYLIWPTFSPSVEFLPKLLKGIRLCIYSRLVFALACLRDIKNEARLLKSRYSRKLAGTSGRKKFTLSSMLTLQSQRERFSALARKTRTFNEELAWSVRTELGNRHCLTAWRSSPVEAKRKLALSVRYFP